MDLSGAPVLSRNEKLVMRSSERKGIFAEKFENIGSQQGWGLNNPITGSRSQHKSTNSNDSYSSFEEDILLRGKDREESKSRTKELQGSHPQYSPSDSSFSLGGSAVWVGDESGLDLATKDRDTDSISSLMASSTLVGSSSRPRRSTDASSSSSHLPGKDQAHRQTGNMQAHHEHHRRQGMVKDTHFYHTTVGYKDHQLPIKMPLSTFPEEVGDVSHTASTASIVILTDR